MRVRPRSVASVFYDKVMESMYTPSKEIWRLKQYEFHPVFVFGQEQKGMGQHKRLNHSPRAGVGFTTTAHFSLNVSRKLGFPVALSEHHEDFASKLFGEVYLVSPSDLIELDKLYQNGIFFHRVRRAVSHYDLNLPPERRERRITLCHMYLGIPEVWLKRRAEGDINLLQIKENANAPYDTYYQYTLVDDASAIPF